MIDIIQSQIEYYRQRAEEYDRTATPVGDTLAVHGSAIRRALEGFAANGDVLEIACGTGNATKVLVQTAGHLTALDPSPEVIDIARAKVANDSVTYVCADIFRWEPDRVYDCVVFTYWLSHVPRDLFEEFWSRVDSCLTNGGRVFFADESADAWRKERWIDEQQTVVKRRLEDGREFEIVKIFWAPEELEARLRGLGWDIQVTGAGPFMWGSGTRA